MIKISGTLKILPCHKNEYSYMMDIYATNIQLEKGFGTIVKQRKPITNTALEREEQRKADAMKKEREEQNREKERIERMEKERAEQHAKRLRSERHRTVM